MVVPVIIPVYSHLDYTEKCLKSVWANTKIPCEIIIVDDVGKEPVIIEWLRSIEGYNPDNPPLLIRHERNQGFTKACNTGIKFALTNLPTWRFLVLLNNDTEVQPEWLEAIKETVENAKNVGIVGAKLLNMNNPDEIYHGGTMDLLGTHKGGRESEGHCNKRTDEVWITGACMGITREALLYCGLLDESFVNFCSDSGYCLTARSKGFRVIYQPKCRVYHKQGATVRDAVSANNLAKDQQKLIDLWGGQWLQNIIKELPLGISRNIQQKG